MSKRHSNLREWYVTYCVKQRWPKKCNNERFWNLWIMSRTNRFTQWNPLFTQRRIILITHYHYKKTQFILSKQELNIHPDKATNCREAYEVKKTLTKFKGGTCLEAPSPPGALILQRRLNHYKWKICFELSTNDTRLLYTRLHASLSVT